MKATERTQFAGIWAELEAEVLDSLGDPTEADRALTERFVSNMQAADDAMAAAMAEPFIDGTKGQQIEHPGFQIATRCDQRAVALARQLKLISPPDRRPSRTARERSNQDRTQLGRLRRIEADDD
jgi:hypothetical protein